MEFIQIGCTGIFALPRYNWGAFRAEKTHLANLSRAGILIFRHFQIDV